MVTTKPPQTLELRNLAADPADEWQRLLKFVNLTRADWSAMAESVETLLTRAPELVIGTYDYLLSVPATAAILGWEQGADEAHLAERRRFFAIWVARTLGMDTSDEFAHYLFRAGKFHAGHGPRNIHTPPAYITGSIGLVNAAFSQYMQEANLSAKVIAGASAGWNKYLMVQLHLMMLGYTVARELDSGDLSIEVTLYGRLRNLANRQTIEVHITKDATAKDLLHKFFSYYPQIRDDALDLAWHSKEELDSLWLVPYPVYTPKKGWRMLINGHNLSFNGGFDTQLHVDDKISIFPPGR
ncbi:MAG: MoaD/ThiS family protein [Anaerolineales bacterium]|nr:MoaD/ThiS family protein [Anaerolineales bacterium]